MEMLFKETQFQSFRIPHSFSFINSHSYAIIIKENINKAYNLNGMNRYDKKYPTEKYSSLEISKAYRLNFLIVIHRIIIFLKLGQSNTNLELTELDAITLMGIC